MSVSSGDYPQDLLCKFGRITAFCYPESGGGATQAEKMTTRRQQYDKQRQHNHKEIRQQHRHNYKHVRNHKVKKRHKTATETHKIYTN